MNNLEKFYNSRMLSTGHIKRHPYANICIEATLASHIVNSQIIASWVYDKIQEYEIDLNINKIIMRILFHDIEETITTDIPRHVKRFNESTHKSIEDFSDICKAQLFSLNFKDDSFIQLCFNDGKSKVFIKITDYLDLIYASYKKVYIDGDKSFLFIPAYYMQWYFGINKGKKGEKFFENLYDLINKEDFNEKSKEILINIIEESRVLLKRMYQENESLCERINENCHFFDISNNY